MGTGSRAQARERRPKRGGRLLQLPPSIGRYRPASGPAQIQVMAAIGRRQVSCGLVTRTLNPGDRQYGTYRPRSLNGHGVPRPGTGTAPETGRPPARLTVWKTPDPGPPEPLLSFSTLTPARGRRVLHHSQVRPATGPLGTRQTTALSPLGPGGGLPRTWLAGTPAATKASAAKHQPVSPRSRNLHRSGQIGRASPGTGAADGTSTTTPSGHYSTRTASDPVTRTAA